MESHRQRYEKTLALLEAQGLKASLWPGLDLTKQSLVEGEHVCRFCSLPVTSQRGFDITVGEAGCYFAHVRLMKHLLAQNVERALVLECDAQPQENLPSLLEEIEQLDSSYELIFLDHRDLGAHRKMPSHRLAGGGNLHLVRSRFNSCAAYIVSRTAIEKLLPQLLTMRQPIDHILTKPLSTGVTVYVVKPRVIKIREVSSIRKTGQFHEPYFQDGVFWTHMLRALSFFRKMLNSLVQKYRYFSKRIPERLRMLVRGEPKA